MELREIGWEDVNWICLDQGMQQRRELVNTAMNLSGSIKTGNFLTS
jgi:hypothetical protein